MDRGRERSREKKEGREGKGRREGGRGGERERGRALHTQCLGIPPGIPPPPQLTCCGLNSCCCHNTIGALTVPVPLWPSRRGLQVCAHVVGMSEWLAAEATPPPLPGRARAHPQLYIHVHMCT